MVNSKNKSNADLKHEREMLVDTIREMAVHNGLIDDREPEYKRDLCNLYHLVCLTIDLRRRIKETYPNYDVLQSMSQYLLGIEGVLGHLLEEVIQPVDMMIFPDLVLDGTDDRNVEPCSSFSDVQKYYSNRKKETNYEEIRDALAILLW